MIIYYVGADIAPESKWNLFKYFNTEIKRPHSTLVYSRKWFPYKTAKCFPLIIEPPYELEVLKGSLVLCFQNSRFFQRYIELRNLGATSDFDHFKSHITISPPITPNEWNISKLNIPDFPIILSNEYYGTWEENKE
jgi:hypothetical protein